MPNLNYGLVNLQIVEARSLRLLLGTSHRCNFIGKVVLLLLNAFAQHKADKATNLDVFASLSNRLLHKLFYRDVLITNEGLIHQSHFFQALVNAALNDFFFDVVWLTCQVIAAHFDRFLFFSDFCGDVANLDILHVGASSNLHRHVANESLKGFATSYEVGFAVDFYEYTHTTTRVNILTH